MYTLADLEKAKAELASWEEKWDRYSGNNPNKFQSNIKSARSKVRIITESLKSDGKIERSDKEKLEQALNQAYPNARSKQEVEFEGERYQLKFYPLEKSRSGKTVTNWGREWVKIS